MARVYTAREICERALRMIGAFPLSESAPDGEMLREALYWLDLNLSQEAGVRKLFHLISQGINLTLEPGRRQYALRASLGVDYPTDGIQYPKGAWMIGTNGERRHVEIMSAEKWKSVSNDLTPGLPSYVYIDRQSEPTLWTYPTLPSGASGTFRLQLDVQRYAPNVSPGGITGTRPQGEVLHGFRQSWQRYLIYKLAIDLALGGVHKLAEQSLARFEKEAEKARRALEAYENQSHDNEDPVARPYDWQDYGPDNRNAAIGGGAVVIEDPDDPVSVDDGDFNGDFNNDFS